MNTKQSSDTLQLIERLSLENRILKHVMDELSEGVYITDENEIITWINRDAAASDGVRRQEIIGKSEEEVFSEISRFHRQVKQSGQETPLRYIYYYLPKGQRTDLLVSSKPYFEQGRLKAIYSIGFNLKTIRALSELAISLPQSPLFSQEKK